MEPSKSGTVERDGVRIAYEVFGDGEQTVVFVPIDPIIESRAWKAQVPWLSRRARVITIDPRGNGRSDRPADPAAYGQPHLVADTVAVMDELGVDSAVLVGICTSAWTAVLTAAEHPDRVDGLIAIAPWLPFVTPPLPHRVAYPDDEVPDTDEGWAKVTNWGLRRDYRGAMEFFFGECAAEPHSSKVIEDCVGWALQIPPDILITADNGPVGVADREGALDVMGRVHCPALVIHGDDDRCQPASRADLLAEILGAEQVTIGGAGHLPMAREPVAVNKAIGGFLDRLWPRPVRRRYPVPARREKRVLYLSSPIGLGHGRRDLAIAEELRRARPDVRIDWLAQPPLTDWLRRRGETVHPASAFLASEAAHIDGLAGEHDLHAFEAIRQMDEILVANFMVFSELAEQEHFDLWIGDEAWELDHFLHENPELKTTGYAWMTDFVGWLPMTEDSREAELTADYNAEMLDHVARLPRIRDRAIFVGDPQDVVRTPFGPGLPDIRDWTTAHYDFAGYVTGFDPAEIADRTALRESVGFGDEPVCVVAVGGSGVGGHLLRRAVEAYPLLRERRPGMRMVVVTGPRIDPASLPATDGVEVRGWLPDLHRLLAAADVALVQGGLTTTMELTAAGRPFVYVPLQHHFEQNVHVRHRLERYGAGRCVPWTEASPERLADELAALVGTAPGVAPVDPGGAARAAALLAELL
ncbi:alpha/beta fold hydrolase [Blastococcus sp. CT_GayMR16]|uniref:alpha/beta hydrolase n=1 Tax=Blastococcus sp. CT_GayMR16 TaxID=2559607 RepID=UPI001ADDAD29|nr:alpha/beta fold hydrolase [Blastococcus sp. CT_GayMR16]